MSRERLIYLIGLIEILIGIMTLGAVGISVVTGMNTKSPNVFIFVVFTATLSLLLGTGLLRFNRIAYLTLIYFASVIVLSKILILAQIITMNGALETTMSPMIKEGISIFYHSSLILYLSQKDLSKLFIN